MLRTSFLVVLLGYRLLTLAGCAYLVGWQDWSPWWFVLVVATFVLVENDDLKCKCKDINNG